MLYEKLYCARGEMENRIKECQLDLFADRTSAATMRANQLRLWFASMAYVLLGALRRIGLKATQFADATCGTIRLKLLKIGALVRISVRRVKVAMASGHPWQRDSRSPTPRSAPPLIRTRQRTAHIRTFDAARSGCPNLSGQAPKRSLRRAIAVAIASPRQTGHSLNTVRYPG